MMCVCGYAGQNDLILASKGQGLRLGFGYKGVGADLHLQGVHIPSVGYLFIITPTTNMAGNASVRGFPLEDYAETLALKARPL